MQPLSVDIREAARLLSVAPFTIRRRIAKGLLRSVRVGSRVLVPLSALREIVEESKCEEVDGSDEPQTDTRTH
jgi:excisionase family DNA binding protein